MAGYLGSRPVVVQVDGYQREESESRYVNVSGDDFSGHLDFVDDAKARFGSSDELHIYTESSGSGHSYIQGDNIVIRSAAGTARLTVTSNDVDVSSGALKVGGTTVIDSSRNGSFGTITASGIDVTGNANFADNGKAIFGAGSDLQIYHDGSNSHIKDVGTGNFELSSNGDGFYFRDGSNNYLLTLSNGGPAQLWHNGSQKLATTSTGVDINGALTSDGLTVNSGTNNTVAKFESSDAGAFIILEDSGSTNDGNRIAVEGDVMSFATGDSERMRIDSTGRVMIGGTTVTDVNMLNIQGSGASSNIGVVLNDTNTSKIYGIQNGGSQLRFHDYSASATRMLIDSSGHVGIGVTPSDSNSFGRALDVGSTTGGALYLRDVGGSKVGIVGQYNEQLSINSKQSDGNIGFYTGASNNERMRITTDKVQFNVDAKVDADNSHDLGAGGARWKDLYLAGKLSIDAPSGNTSNVIKASANNTRATLEITGKTSAGTSVRGIVGSYGDASKVDIGTLSGHAVSFLTNNQERAIINTDGRFLVGKNNASHSVEGGAIFDDGRIYSTTDSQFTFTANRLNSDGEIIRIQKNTSTVGSIVVFDSDNVGFLSGVNNHGGIICGTASIVPALSGTYSSGATDIGTNTSKWRDLYLSGGIQFDARSNKLEDYEEGTTNLEIVIAGTAGNYVSSYAYRTAPYVKIGRMVFCQISMYVTFSSQPSGTVRISGLPFTEGQGGGYREPGMVVGNTNLSNFVRGAIVSNSDDLVLYDGSGGQQVVGADLSTTFWMHGCITYQTQ